MMFQNNNSPTNVMGTLDCGSSWHKNIPDMEKAVSMQAILADNF